MSYANHTVFMRKKNEGVEVVMPMVKIDDIVMKGNNEKEIKELKTNLGEKFKIKNLRTLKTFLELRLLGLRKELSSHNVSIYRISY